MGENGLLARHRVGRNQEKTHDGTIVTDKVNEMWGTDMSQTFTLEEGRAYVFVAVEHANSEIIGIHAARSANRFEALDDQYLKTKSTGKPEKQSIDCILITKANAKKLNNFQLAE